MSEIEILDAESNVTPKDYLNHLLEFSKQSTQENSIIFDFEVDANYCHCKITKYEIDGTRKEERQETFNNIEEVIEEILEPFLKKIFETDHKHNKIHTQTVRTIFSDNKSNILLNISTSIIFVLTNIVNPDNINTIIEKTIILNLSTNFIFTLLFCKINFHYFLPQAN